MPDRREGYWEFAAAAKRFGKTTNRHLQKGMLLDWLIDWYAYCLLIKVYSFAGKVMTIKGLCGRIFVDN